ncbi:HAD family hydrolase [Actinomyces faecalis]|uniref:HAD family hydrolase n=1 Tax=Actinomyces faecalis TaxID=2722820 RepID=UPI001553B8C4|nr:HAD family phosphatase [Actinomyces faecalis]
MNRDDAGSTDRGADTVVFDYGNVLYAWDPYGALAGRATIRQWEEFVREGGFGRWNEMCDAGVSFDQIEEALVSAYPDRPDWLALLRLYWERFSDTLTGPVAGTARIIEELAGAGVPLYLLSNFNDRLFEANRHLCPQLDLFDALIVSGAEHETKPGRRIFEILLDRHGLAPERTLFVDDSLPNITAAQDLGLRTHHFRGAGRLRAALTEAGLLPAAAAGRQ